MTNVVWVNFKSVGKVKDSENTISVKSTGVGEYEIKAVHVDFKERKEQKETMDKIKQSNVSAASLDTTMTGVNSMIKKLRSMVDASQRFDDKMGNPLEAIDKMISDLKPKEKEAQND